MTEDFQPKNELESQLLAAQQGRIDAEEFMQALLEAQLFMPVEERLSVGGLQSSDRANPLSLQAEDGTKVLVLFTSPERAKPFVKNHPGYEGGLLAEFTWIVSKMGSGYGISLNPGWEVGLDMEPEMVAELASRQ